MRANVNSQVVAGKHPISSKLLLIGSGAPKHASLASTLDTQQSRIVTTTMHSSLNRLQAVFGFFTTVALVVACLAAVSVVLFPSDATASVSLKNVQV